MSGGNRLGRFCPIGQGVPRGVRDITHFFPITAVQYVSAMVSSLSPSKLLLECQAIIMAESTRHGYRHLPLCIVVT